MGNRYTGLIEHYRDWLPVADDTRIISLSEGNTPLIRLNNLPRDLGRDVDLYVKYEGLNPTGSFKDRGMTMAVTQAVAEGSRAIICASTGNTSAAAAAYAARAGITAFVLIPDGKIALGKLAQAMMHGAVVMQIQGNFDAGMQLVKEVAAEAPVTIVNSINPYRLQGQKTAAFEIVDVLGRAPDYHCLPVGNAGNISAYWMGYGEYHARGVVGQRPVMCGYQASGAAPSWDKAVAAQQGSGGWFDEFDDAQILNAQKLLAQREGIFCEPASAISIAGAMNDICAGRIPEGSTVVCTLTGHGLKDPDTAIGQCQDTVSKVPAELDAVKRAILDRLA